MKFQREVLRRRLSMKIPKPAKTQAFNENTKVHNFSLKEEIKVPRKWKLKEDFIRSIFLVRAVL